MQIFMAALKTGGRKSCFSEVLKVPMKVLHPRFHTSGVLPPFLGFCVFDASIILWAFQTKAEK